MACAGCGADNPVWANYCPHCGLSLRWEHRDLVVPLGLTTRDLAGTTHAYPTYNDAVWNPAVADLRQRLTAPTPARVIRTAARLRRTWLGRLAR